MESVTASPWIGRQTALAAIQAYNDNSIADIMAVRAPNCIHEILPQSIPRPPMNNQEYEKYLDGTWHNFRNFHAEVIDIIEDRDKNKVVIHARSTAETTVGKYANEYMLVFHLTWAGDKVVRFQEFVDSGATVAFFGRLRKHIAENGNPQLAPEA
ncbi:hypothetical protein QBC46DRAFT_289884 [Diplogelasinospora grovesii]|uniref:SnoaL-like domain-containing protein n=1 Tax=Diplogelasinospora grovesii TaxID=303347 RepID=A0AAN6N8K5_9PEZI|nr:hypothetical protein QBC46DRAFT_289884 [Diplogelasinospora grovesii]